MSSAQRTSGPDRPQIPLINETLTERMHETYKHLHANPELSMCEENTATFIEQRLKELEIPHFRCGGTGVVGLLSRGVDSPDEGQVVAFRADIDGLPIKEATGLPYESKTVVEQTDGTLSPVMHGCGHDVHTTALLTAAELLTEDTSWSGTAVLIFQPGEEIGAGASAMIEDKLWERAPKPSVVFGQHVVPELTGHIYLRNGSPLSAADSFRVRVLGQGSHGSAPQNSIDPVVLGAHMIVRLQTIISRSVTPTAAAVLTVGTFHGGTKENIISDVAEFTINVRTQDPETRETVLNGIHRIINAEAAASGAPDPEIHHVSNFPQSVNDPDQTDSIRSRFIEVFGNDRVHGIPQGMASEDFGRLGEAIGVPSVYWMTGGFSEITETTPQNHSPLFAPTPDPTLQTATQLAVTAIKSVLSKG